MKTYGYIVRFTKEIERKLFREKCHEEGVSGSSILTELAGLWVMGRIKAKGKKISDICRENGFKPKLDRKISSW
mgnify:CR=1 FL=1